MGPRTWKNAQSFAELCELGARFVEGRLDSFPGWGACALDEESLPLAARLARFNRAGLLTLASQPGRTPDAQGYEQRAFASGFCLAHEAGRWHRLRALGLAARCFRAGERGRAAVAVSRQAGAARVLAGHDARALELELFAGRIGPAAARELEECAYWSAWDPRWGREEALWSAIERVWC